MTDKLDRDHRVNMRLSGKMYERLKVVSEELGMSLSTVAAFAVGEFVSIKEQQLMDSIERQARLLATEDKKIK